MFFRAPASLLVIAGGLATWSCVGSELASRLVVKVSDARGVPVRGSLVSFTAVSASGSPFAGSALTNKDGIAQDRWTLGTAAGRHEMEARLLDPNSGTSLAFVTF